MTTAARVKIEYITPAPDGATIRGVYVCPACEERVMKNLDESVEAVYSVESFENISCDVCCPEVTEWTS
jgi:hypothetical protein